MKKILVCIAIAAIAIGFASCGTNKSAVTSTSQQDVVVTNPCIQVQEEAPARRAYGSGMHFKNSTARNFAEGQARASFARKIKAAIIAATEEIGISLEQYAGNAETGNIVRDQSAEGSDYVSSLAEEMVKNSYPIKTHITKNKANNQYEVWVCLELDETDDKTVDYVIEKVEESIPADQRQVLEERHNKVRNRVLGALKSNE